MPVAINRYFLPERGAFRPPSWLASSVKQTGIHTGLCFPGRQNKSLLLRIYLPFASASRSPIGFLCFRMNRKKNPPG